MLLGVLFICLLCHQFAFIQSAIYGMLVGTALLVC